MAECAAPGCTTDLPPPRGAGRDREYCSELCRQRARRERAHFRLAIETADLIRAASDTRLCNALAVQHPAALSNLHATLVDHAEGRTGGQS